MPSNKMLPFIRRKQDEFTSLLTDILVENKDCIVASSAGFDAVAANNQIAQLAGSSAFDFIATLTMQFAPFEGHLDKYLPTFLSSIGVPQHIIPDKDIAAVQRYITMFAELIELFNESKKVAP